MNSILKKHYEKANAKKRNELDNADLYLQEIVRFSDEKLDDIKETVNKSKVLDGNYVWALFGKINKTGVDEVCLQVGASIDIKGEILCDIDIMYSKYIPISNPKSKNTQFYENTYEINDGEDKKGYLYRAIKQKYEELIFYALDIDVYLGIKDFKCDNKIINDILDFSKMYYAETMFAYETLAIYWNVFRSGVGLETLKMILGEDE